MKKWFKSPFVSFGSFAILISLVFICGRFMCLPYFSKTELGWILTALFAGVVTLIFGVFYVYQAALKEKRKKC